MKKRMPPWLRETQGELVEVPDKGTPMKPKSMPAWTSAKNATKAVGRVLAAVSTGKKVRVDDVQRERRLAVCDGCDESVPKELPVTRRRCANCTCFLGGEAGKAAWATETCPLGKW